MIEQTIDTKTRNSNNRVKIPAISNSNLEIVKDDGQFWPNQGKRLYLQQTEEFNNNYTVEEGCNEDCCCELHCKILH